jgi:pyridoxal phosphate enzyme (YggS family)
MSTMPVNEAKYQEIQSLLSVKNVQLVAVSKVQQKQDILKMYELGQRDFGENYVQELVDKYDALPKDINWHFIGHLQSNKVKYIASFVHLVHGVDSLKLLQEINKQAKKLNRTISVLLQVHIAQEETKFGMDEDDLKSVVHAVSANGSLRNISIEGLMGMASFSDDTDQVRNEMRYLKQLFDTYAKVSAPGFNFKTLSMGMSGDFEIAIEEGSNMVRIGSLLFGGRY